MTMNLVIKCYVTSTLVSPSIPFKMHPPLICPEWSHLAWFAFRAWVMVGVQYDVAAH